MAEFPNAIKNFLILQDGVDRIIAAHPNDRGGEITAIQTMLGAIGSTLVNTDSFKNMLRDKIRGVVLVFNSVAQLTIRAGEIAILDASGNLRFRRNTSDLTVTWADIDTGAEAADTTYYVYVVADASGTGFTALISTNATTPTGATFFRKLGSFRNNSGSDIESITSDSEGGKVYDSAWFLTTTGSSTTKIHDLGVVDDLLITIYGADDINGTNARILPHATGAIGADNHGATVRAFTTTSLIVTVGGNGTGGLDNGGTAVANSFPYVRVRARALK